jgi:hypothetical protein
MHLDRAYGGKTPTAPPEPRGATLWATYGRFSALSHLLHAISSRWKFSASPPSATFLVPTGFPQGVSRGEGKYGRTALISGAGYPTTPGSPHPLTGSTPWPTRGPTRPRHRPPGESERMDEGIQKPDLELLDREQGKRAFSGFLTPMVFQITPWVVGSAGRTSHMRERALSRRCAGRWSRMDP